MSAVEGFRPYGSIISNKIFKNIDDFLFINDKLYVRGEFNENICDMIVSFLSVPTSVIIEHGQTETLVTMTSFSSTHSILYRFPTIIGQSGINKVLVGNDAINKLSSLVLNYPIENGIIHKNSLVNIDKIWYYIFNNLLSLNGHLYRNTISSHSLLLILPPQTMSNISICDKIIQFLFEIYNIPALAIMDKASLTCHYYCYKLLNNYKKNAIVIDFGYHILSITPIIKFQLDSDNMITTKLFSGKSLEQYLYTVLNENKFPSEIASDLKELENIQINYIKITSTRNKYVYLLDNCDYDGIEYVTNNNKLHCWIPNWILYDIGEYIFNPYYYSISFPHYINIKEWIKPKTYSDLRKYTMKVNDKFSYLSTSNSNASNANDKKEKNKKCKIKGLAELIIDVINKYKLIEIRQYLLNNIIVTGNRSNIYGLKERLHQEIVDLVMINPSILVKNYNKNYNNIIDYNAVSSWITVIVGDKKNECSSICASILTSMRSTANIWLLREEYERSKTSIY